jgi:hypothetical protein
VDPPQVQSPEQPGTIVYSLLVVGSLLQIELLLLNSVKPVQQARCPLPPHGAG